MGPERPRKNEKPSTFIKRMIQEGVDRKAAGTPVPGWPVEPIPAYGADCPTCRGRRTCDQCGNKA